MDMRPVETKPEAMLPMPRAKEKAAKRMLGRVGSSPMVDATELSQGFGKSKKANLTSNDRDKFREQSYEEQV